jgi:hypothetical protein
MRADEVDDGRLDHHPVEPAKQGQGRVWRTLERPSRFLDALWTKLQGRGGYDLRELQAFRSDLFRKLDAIRDAHEVQAVSIESRLSQLGHNFKSRLQIVEGQQSAMRTQLNNLREHVQTDGMDGVPSLQIKLDELDARFDRFIRVDVGVRVRSMQDELRQVTLRLSELTAATESMSRQLRNTLRATSRRAKASSDSANRKQKDIDDRTHWIGLRLKDIEAQLEELTAALAVVTQEKSNAPQDLDKQAADAENAVNRLQVEVIPRIFDEASTSILTSMTSVVQLCDSAILKLEAQRDGAQPDEEEAPSAEELDGLIAGATEAQDKIGELDQDAGRRLGELEERVAEGSAQLEEQLRHGQDDGTAQPKDAHADRSNLRKQAQDRCRKLKEEIMAAGALNMQEQKDLGKNVGVVRDGIVGSGNLLDRLIEIEGRVDWCVE